ncbi:MAG TPA: c-type cytochrome [Longimicrobiales bacterium]
MRSRAAALIGCVLLSGACEKHEFEPPSRAERVSEADSLYSPALFDSITWTSDSLRIAVGNDIFASRCRRCHGYLGHGGPVEILGDTVTVPSVVEPDWQYAGDIPGILRRIFTGHPLGMPTWGVAGLEMREIDAAAFYIDRVLRPEAAGLPTGR